MLYDFSLEQGDSIDCFGEYIQVDTVYYCQFGNLPILLKHIGFKQNGYKTGTWIEGVGSTSGVLAGTFELPIMTGGISNLVCYFEDQELVWHNSYFDTCFPVGSYNSVNDQHQKINSLQINYDKGQIRFSLNNDYDYRDNILQLIDLSGKKILEKQLVPYDYLTISKETVNPGIYLFLFQNREIKESGKIVVK